MSSSHGEYVLDWNEHGNNFSLSFEELLQANKLVDVQLVADGHLFSAHRLVLSAMSPYFCNMFTQMPANQQAFVFLKDISKRTMEGLITFIYRGEVKVKHECLDEFMNAAKALKIQGLNDSNCFKWFDSQRASTSTLAKPTFSGSVYHPFANMDIQYQSVKRSTQYTPLQRPANDVLDFDWKSRCPELNYDRNYDENNSSNNHSMNDFNETSFNQWNGEANVGSNVGATAPKRKKINKDLSEYNIVADIRDSLKSSGQHLHYAEEKFQKHSKPNADGKQRWQCTRAHSQKCRAAVRTVDVNGVTMMKILMAEHSHVN